MDARAERYSAGIMSESPWFLEFKKLVQLYHSGLTYEEVRRRCIEENVFGMQTERRVVSTFQYLNRRFQFLDAALVDLFCDSDLATQKIINLIAVVNGDRLFFEFLNEVYREKCILGFTQIEGSDVNTFFRNKSIESTELAAWKDTTFSKVGNSYFSFMLDANLIQKKKRGSYDITPPIPDIALERHLQYNGKESLLKAIAGVK